MSTKTTKGEKPEAQEMETVNAEQLLQRITELENLLKQRQPQNFEQAIKYYQEKQRKINELANFEHHAQELTEAMAKVQEKVKAGDFDAKMYRISLTHYREYGEGQKLFGITNTFVIGECLAHILQKVSEKAEQLRKEIEQ